jgi:ubiquinone/menaquinone biosynthesis C-methylase UbiE
MSWSYPSLKLRILSENALFVNTTPNGYNGSMNLEGIWPKVPPQLTEKQKIAREKFMLLWHQLLPNKYGMIEKFNHGFPANLPIKAGSKTLEVGAGLGEHLKYEDLSTQQYHCLEYREEFCGELKKKISEGNVHQGDIQTKQSWPDRTFDRILAIHVLEHLPNLPAATREIHRLLKDDGVFDIVIPCEGGMAHTFARKISAERVFKKHFGMDFTPIRQNEHVNNFREIYSLLQKSFAIKVRGFFPLKIPVATINLCAGFRLVKRSDSL